jgi:lysophospholipid acyltransferase (LPLAT)-like uncharacterized protein
MQVFAEQQFKGTRSREETLRRAYEFSELSHYSAKQRAMIRLADVGFYGLIRLVGRTVRFEVDGWDNFESIVSQGQIPIYSAWHSEVLLSTYFWKHRQIVVMTSQSFDGEYIARFIKRFGYGAARGSSTRGSTGAMVEMVRLMRLGRPAGFTIDGPKGPRHVAKMGSVLLAKKTGQPIMPFSVTAQHYWQANSWDRLQVPKPFTRARVDIARPIYVPSDANNQELLTKRNELQQALDELKRRGERWRQR